MALLTLRHLPNRERRLILKTIALMWRIQFGLWLNPALTVEGFNRTLVNRSSLRRAPIYQLLWAIQTAVHFVPRTTSLTEALTARVLFAIYGYDTKLHVGVLKESELFQAHAWLTHDTDILLGEHDRLNVYRPLSTARGQGKVVWRSARSS